MKVINKTLDVIKKIEYGILVLILAVIVLATFLQVIGRYTPLPFSSAFEELSTFGFVWMTMIGAGTCVREGGHMTMDFVISFLPENKRIYSKLLNNVIAFLIGIVIVYCSSLLLPTLRRANMLSAAMQLPLWIQNLATPTGGALIGFWGLVNVVRDIREIVKHEPLPESGDMNKEE